MAPAHRRLIQQDQARPGHQRAANGAHLLLAARGVAGLRTPPLAQTREVFIDLVHLATDGGAAVLARVGAGEQILLNRQVAEAVPAFHHLHAATAHQLVGAEIVHLQPIQDDAAARDFPALGTEQVGDRLQRRALAGAVGTEQRHHATDRNC